MIRNSTIKNTEAFLEFDGLSFSFSCEDMKRKTLDQLYFIEKGLNLQKPNKTLQSDYKQQTSQKKHYTSFTTERIKTSTRYDVIHNFSPALFHEVAVAYCKNSLLDNCITKPFTIIKNQILDFNTYFNSFNISNYDSLTDINSCFLFIKFLGTTRAVVKCYDSEGHADILVDVDLSSDLAKWAVIPIPTIISSLGSNRLAVEFTGKSEISQVFEASIGAESNNPNPDLFILIRTMNRKRDCCRVISQIIQDNRLNREFVKLIVLDASDEINYSDFSHLETNLNLHIFQSCNYGSSGNLAKLIEHVKSSYSCKENDIALIVDDDILFDCESIMRAYFILKHAKNQNIALSSAFLDKCRPLNIDSTVGVYGDYADESVKGMRLIPLRGAGRIDDEQYLKYSANLVQGSIAAFYFLILPLKKFASHYPMPFFLKWDDIDYSYRLKKDGMQIVNIPGIAIWHDAFYDCMPSWQEVLNLRHGIYCDIAHLNISWKNLHSAFCEIIIRHLQVFDYNLVFSMIEAVKSVLSLETGFMDKEFLKKNSAYVKRLVDLYNKSLIASARIFPDKSKVLKTYDRGDTYILTNEGPAEFVHEIFPEPKITESRAFVKISRKSERFYVSKYDKIKHEELMESIISIKDFEDNYAQIQKSIVTNAKHYCSQDHWRSIFQNK